MSRYLLFFPFLIISNVVTRFNVFREEKSSIRRCIYHRIFHSLYKILIDIRIFPAAVKATTQDGKFTSMQHTTQRASNGFPLSLSPFVREKTRMHSNASKFIFATRVRERKYSENSMKKIRLKMHNHRPRCFLSDLLHKVKLSINKRAKNSESRTNTVAQNNLY